MKKIVLFIFVIILTIPLVFTSCEKDEVDVLQEVQFKIDNLSENGTMKSATVDGMLKSASLTPEEIPCKPYLASYVKVTIDGQVHKVATFYIIENDFEVLYTNALMLSPGNHQIESFIVWFDNGTPSDEADDIPLSATPEAGSFLADFINNPLDISFTVASDKKSYVNVEVICYNDDQAADFGFFYSGVTEITVQGLNFFGDFCIKKKSDYIGSLYEQQSNWGDTPGEFIDVPAIARIELWKKTDDGPWNHEADFDNTYEGETIKVIYSDHKTKVDSFELRLYIYVRIGSAFDYKHFYTWKLRDNEKPSQTIDNVGGRTTYYCLGSCSPQANYIFPGYMTLPPSVTYKIVGNTAPGSLGAYVDAEISNAGVGYEFGDGVYQSYCADHDKEIYTETEYQMDVYSSLYPELMPVFAQGSLWGKINWLINHIGLPGTNNLYPGHNWNDVQGAIWLLDNWNGVAKGGVSDVNSTMQQMASDAESSYEQYVIPVGGWASVVFIPEGTEQGATEATIQTTFIQIDP